MSSFLCKFILFGRIGFGVPNNLYSLRWFSVRSSEQPFTVSYLINSLGLSEPSALWVSERVSFKSKDEPDKAIEFFRDFGFTHTQISRLVRSFPKVLVCDVEKSVLPKLQFLESKGISRPELAKALSIYPAVLKRSLSKRIIPGYEFFRSIGKSDDKANIAIRQLPNILVDKTVMCNVAILQEHKVPDSNIATLLRRDPICFMVSLDWFRKVVEEVVEMGFNSSRINFVVAVSTLRSMTKSNWESKVDVYKKWGWSHEEFLEAFVREPRCMRVSEDKISACMDFITNTMGWATSIVVKYPLAVAMSLEKRVIPRCSVYQLSLSKGLVKKPVGLSSLLNSTEEKFLQRFITPYKNEAPALLKVYKEKMKLANG